jgi:hypothetical protein
VVRTGRAFWRFWNAGLLATAFPSSFVKWSLATAAFTARLGAALVV